MIHCKPSEVRGLKANHTKKMLGCFDNIRWLIPFGHDIYHDSGICLKTLPTTTYMYTQGGGGRQRGTSYHAYRGYRLGNLACHPTTMPWCLFWYHSPGKKQAITIRSSGGLSDAEIDRMVNEAESMRESDQRKKDGWTDGSVGCRMLSAICPGFFFPCCPGWVFFGWGDFFSGGGGWIGRLDDEERLAS